MILWSTMLYKNPDIYSVSSWPFPPFNFELTPPPHLCSVQLNNTLVIRRLWIQQLFSLLPYWSLCVFIFNLLGNIYFLMVYFLSKIVIFTDHTLCPISIVNDELFNMHTYTLWPRSLDPFYYSKLIHKMGQDFLNIKQSSYQLTTNYKISIQKSLFSFQYTMSEQSEHGMIVLTKSVF